MILVTGGTGHLGANLVRRLRDEGEQVRVLVKPSSDRRALDGLAVEIVEGDLRDFAAMERAVAGCTHAYHCAAKLSTVAGGEREIFDTNVVGTRNLLEAARLAGLARVVVTGSLGAIGHRAEAPSDEEVPFYPFHHALAYEHTKYGVEYEVLRAHARGLDVVIAISCAIMGPNDYEPSRMGGTLLAFARGELPAYVPGGFEFVSVRDLVEGHLLAMRAGKSGQKYLFSTEFVTIDELMGIFEQVTGRPRPRLRLSARVMGAIASVVSPLMTRFAPSRPQRLTPAAIRLLTLGRRADSSKARRELGYRPSSVLSAVEEAYDDFARRGLVPPRRLAGPGAAAKSASSTPTATANGAARSASEPRPSSSLGASA